jgi:hypothetical protein
MAACACNYLAPDSISPERTAATRDATGHAGALLVTAHPAAIAAACSSHRGSRCSISSIHS